MSSWQWTTVLLWRWQCIVNCIRKALFEEGSTGFEERDHEDVCRISSFSLLLSLLLFFLSLFFILSLLPPLFLSLSTTHGRYWKTAISQTKSSIASEHTRDTCHVCTPPLEIDEWKERSREAYILSTNRLLN